MPFSSYRYVAGAARLNSSYANTPQLSADVAIDKVCGGQEPHGSPVGAVAAHHSITASPIKRWLRDAHTSLTDSSEFNPDIFVSSFQLVEKIPRKECIRSFKQKLLDYSANAAAGILSVGDVVNCLQAFDAFKKTEEDAQLMNFLIMQYDFLYKGSPENCCCAISDLPSSVVAGSSAALKVLKENGEIRERFVSLVLAPLMCEYVASGQSLSPLEIQVVLANIASNAAEGPGFESVMSSLCSIVDISTNIYTESDVQVSMRYCCELQSKSVPGYEVMLCLLSKLRTTVSCSCASEIMYHFKSVNFDSEVATQVLAALFAVLPSEGELMTPREIGRSLYGLQKMDIATAEACNIAMWLNKQIMHTPLDIFFAPTDLSAALYGMRAMSSEHRTVKDLMESIERELLSSDVVFEARHLGMCFTGITGKAEHARFRFVRLVDALTDKLIAFDETGNQMKAGTVSSILNGISALSLQEPCVRRIIAVLVRQMERSQDSYTENKTKTNLAGILYAVRQWNIDSYNCTELKALLHTVSLKLAGSRRVMGGYDLAKCMYGLHSMTNNSKEVRNLLSVLHLKLAQSKNMPFDAVQIARCLYGLKSMNDRSSGPLDLLSSLTDILANCQEV